MNIISAYKCDYCHKCFVRKVDASNHECRCNNNPIKKHCKTCVHGVLGIIDWVEYDKTIPIYGAWCDYLNKSIHDKPYFEECEISCGYDGSEHEIPWTCHNYKYKGYSGFIKGESK